MTKYYDLYGTKTLGIDELRSAVEKALSVNFERHESSYLGGDYFLAGDLRGEHALIQRNHLGDADEQEVAEPEFADHPILLQVNATTRGDDTRELLLGIEGVDFLRRSAP